MFTTSAYDNNGDDEFRIGRESPKGFLGAGRTYYIILLYYVCMDHIIVLASWTYNCLTDQKSRWNFWPTASIQRVF